MLEHCGNVHILTSSKKLKGIMHAKMESTQSSVAIDLPHLVMMTMDLSGQYAEYAVDI